LQAIAHKAYGQATQRTADTHAIEYALFEQITQALEYVDGEGGSNPALWGDAIHRNMQLWTLIATDLLLPENALAPETKGGLLSLSSFVHRTSHEVLSGRAGLADLIEVNRTVMAGLPGSGEANTGEAA